MVEVVRYSATGRRKTSVARVFLSPGSGKIRVNKHAFEEYFPAEVDQIQILEPLKLTSNVNKFDLKINVTGGGKKGQVGAVRLGIARALAKFDSETKTVLKKAECLRRDPRMKERKKPGQKGARKKFQWVKR